MVIKHLMKLLLFIFIIVGSVMIILLIKGVKIPKILMIIYLIMILLYSFLAILKK